mgnify:CR=1 FL=1
MDYAKRLRKLREEKHLSQQELADKLEINRSTYAYYESGKSEPGIDMLLKLSAFYQVSVDYILDNPVVPKNTSIELLLDSIKEFMEEKSC